MSNLGHSSELAENKLILLYIIDRLNMPVGNLQITKIILENRFMNYFLFQQFLNDLCSNNLLKENTQEDKAVYSITESGKKTLSYFIDRIPLGIKARIDNTISEIRKRIKNETLITADFMPESENKYIVTCKVHEDSFPLIDIKISVGTKSDARSICENWKRNPQVIYNEIIESLIKNREQ